MLKNIQEQLFDKNLNKVAIELTTIGQYPETFAYVIEKCKSVLVWNVIYQGKQNACLFQFLGGSIQELQSQPIHNFEEMTARQVFESYLLRAEQFVKAKILTFCSKCGKLLTDEKSIKRGYGPECFKEKNI